MLKRISTLALVASLAMLAWLPASSEATTPLGRFCFQMTGFADLWVWEVEDVGGGAFQVTGNDMFNGPGAMHGGGRILHGHLLMTVQEDSPGPAFHGTHAIDIDLTLPKFPGTTDLVWENSAGVPFASFLDLAFSNVPCPPLGAMAGDPGKPSTSGQ